MALTTAAIGATATPATDLYNALTPLLTAKGWVYVEQASAVNAGTSAIVEVWRTAGSDCYVLFEVDDANARFRVRCSESYNATTHKMIRPCSGHESNNAPTPTANYTVTDAEQTIFQAQAVAATVGWVNIPTSAGGYTYWLGVTAATVLIANNSGGGPHWANAGRLLGTLCPTADGSTVYLAGRFNATNDDCSWTFNASIHTGNVRTSREPLTTIATTGGFCYNMDHPWPLLIANFGGTPGTNHKWQTVMVVAPVVLHGLAGPAYAGTRSHRATIPGWVTYADNVQGTIGDTITVGATVYTIIGKAHESVTGTVDHQVAVDGSIY